MDVAEEELQSLYTWVRGTCQRSRGAREHMPGHEMTRSV